MPSYVSNWSMLTPRLSTHCAKDGERPSGQEVEVLAGQRLSYVVSGTRNSRSGLPADSAQVDGTREVPDVAMNCEFLRQRDRFLKLSPAQWNLAKALATKIPARDLGAGLRGEIPDGRTHKGSHSCSEAATKPNIIYAKPLPMRLETKEDQSRASRFLVQPR